MNEQMFFYPLYPYGNEENGYSERKYSNVLFSPIETLEYGNVFKNEYKGYKNYQPYKINAVTNDEILINLLSLQNYKHDLKLYLDIYPNDDRILSIYKDACKKYKEIKEKYDSDKSTEFFKYL